MAKKFFIYGLAGIGVFIALLAVLPYTLIASPNTTLRIVDDHHQPVKGMRVVRIWSTSEEQKGQDESATDANGSVSFKQIAFRMSWLKRITKPLLILVPASCGPNWEVYADCEFDIYCRDGYKLMFDDVTLKKNETVSGDSDGIHIDDVTYSNSQLQYEKLSISNKRNDIDYTLMVCKKGVH